LNHVRKRGRQQCILPGVVVTGRADAGDCGLNIGVGTDDDGRFAAQLQMGAFYRAGRALEDLLTRDDISSE